MESEHRKIELQSPSDLTYLTSCIRAAARHKLDLHLPPVSDTTEPDELRRQVEELVDAFVAQVLAGMRENISINGMDVVTRFGGEEGDKMDGVVATSVEKEEFEPFDDKLRGQLSSTVAKRDALVAKISQHRRATPATAAAHFQTQFERDSETLFAAQAQAVHTAAGHEIPDVDGIARGDEVVRNWEGAVEGLGRLNKGLPETRARLERCRDVIGYLDAGKKGR